MSTTLTRPSALALVPGPTWNSFEQFRKGGSATLEEIPEHGVGTLVGRGTTYRILREADFQNLVGLAADVHRLQQGLNVVIQAAKIVAKHPDQEHVQLLIHSAALFAGSPVLPTRDGHDAFQLSQEEIDAQASDDFNLENAEIPRPRL
jgi:phosphodiesterase/alkaline phosphatase D-like protein